VVRMFSLEPEQGYYDLNGNDLIYTTVSTANTSNLSKYDIFNLYKIV